MIDFILKFKVMSFKLYKNHYQKISEMMNEFVHLTDKKWDIFEDWKYPLINNKLFSLVGKPQGLWISGKLGTGGWMDWCLNERFYTSSYKCFAVDIKIDYTKLLELSTLEDIKNITEKYKDFTPFEGLDINIFEDFKLIDWNTVSKDYDGIYIKNYNDIYDFRQAWTTVIDCNCACIWNKRAILQWKYLDIS